jgi:hypothetical protein
MAEVLQIFEHERSTVPFFAAYAAAKSRHSPGTPLRGYVPRSTKCRPDPDTKSFTVLETSTSSGSACAATRAPMCTAMPTSFSPMMVHSPVWTPVRSLMPNARTVSRVIHAHRMARAGPSKVARNPSPAVSTSRPRNRASSRRMMP